MRTINVYGIEIELGKFHPHLVYNKELGLLKVILRDCSYEEKMITKYFDLLYDNHPKKKQSLLVGFNLWGVDSLFREKPYARSSISLENLIKRFGSNEWLPYAQSALGGNTKNKEKIIKIARKHQFVWHIPQELLTR